jgi:hypothetical protein
MLALSDSEAFVSKLYGSDLAILDLKKNTIKGTIALNTESKAMALNGTTAYVITDSTGYAVINTLTKTVTTRITVGDYPASIIADAQRNQIVLLSQGSYYRGTTAKIHFIDMTSGMITDSIVIGGTDYVASIVDAGSRGFLLYGDRVGVVSYSSQTITDSNFIPKSYYGGYFDEETNELVLGTAKDFQSNDMVDIYNASTAALKYTFTAGVAAGHFAKYTSGSVRKLFVLNEGRFGGNNASLSSWNYIDNAMTNDLAADLGDVGNDIAIMNGKVYVLLNGSRKIVVLDPNNVK